MEKKETEKMKQENLEEFEEFYNEYIITESIKSKDLEYLFQKVKNFLKTEKTYFVDKIESFHHNENESEYYYTITASDAVSGKGIEFTIERGVISTEKIGRK